MAVRFPMPPISGIGIRKPNRARLGTVCTTFAKPSPHCRRPGRRVIRIPSGSPIASATPIAMTTKNRCSPVSSTISRASCGRIRPPDFTVRAQDAAAPSLRSETRLPPSVVRVYSVSAQEAAASSRRSETQLPRSVVRVYSVSAQAAAASSLRSETRLPRSVVHVLLCKRRGRGAVLARVGNAAATFRCARLLITGCESSRPVAETPQERPRFFTLLAQKPGRLAQRLQPSAPQQRDARGELQSLPHVVRHENRCLVQIPPQCEKHLLCVESRHGIQCAERLVKQQ